MNATTMNIRKSLTFDIDRLETIFPFYFAFNHRLKLIEEGKGLEKLLPSMRIRKKVYAYFSIEDNFSKHTNPSHFRNIEEGVEVILHLNFSDVQLKGTFFKDLESQKTYFLGNPLLKNIDEIERLKLKKEDFSITDTGLDQLFRAHGNSNSIKVLSEKEQDLSSSNLALKNNLNHYLDLFKQSLHELSQPIRNNVSYAQLLKRQQLLDEDLSESIHLVGQGSFKAQRLLNRLREYFQQKEQEKTLETIDVSMVLDSVKNNLYNLLKEQDTTIEYHCKAIVNMDFRHLTFILKSLIENAIYFNLNKEQKIQISCSKREKEWLYTVKDNGVGIESKHLKDVFNPFTKYHTKIHNGVGLSLTTCKMIVELYNGKIWIDSAKGKGTSVYFTIEIK